MSNCLLAGSCSFVFSFLRLISLGVSCNLPRDNGRLMVREEGRSDSFFVSGCFLFSFTETKLDR